MKKVLIGILMTFFWSAGLWAGKPEPVVYAPKNAKNGAVPIAVWLHGYRNFPGFLADEREYFEGVADSLGIAIVGIPGTTPLEDGTLQWSEEPVADHAYIQQVLASLSEKHKLDTKRVALFGFSQGAMVAADVANLYPDAYQGAIVMSPGGFTEPKVRSQKSPVNATQIYFLVCGADEHPGNVQLTRFYAKELKNLGAVVTFKEYPGVSKHTRPPDFKERFPEWIAAILKSRARGE